MDHLPIGRWSFCVKKEENMNLEQFTEKIAVDLQAILPNKYAHVEVHSRNVEKIGGSYLGIELKPEGNIGPLLKARKYYEEYMHGTPYFYVLNLIVNDAVDALDKIPTKLDIDLNKLEENICIQVVQTESNKKYLEKIPHLEIEDLSIICRFNVEIIKNLRFRRFFIINSSSFGNFVNEICGIILTDSGIVSCFNS